MDFAFTPEQEAWRREVREFFERELPDDELERLFREQGSTNAHAAELYRKLGEKGWLGLSWPREYGGQGRSYLDQAILGEELSRGRVPHGTSDVYSTTIHYFGGCLFTFGSEEQRRTWLPLMARGELTSAIGVTEANAGCDAAAIEMRAVEDGDDYILEGTKIFNHAHNCSHMLTVARTDPSAPSKYRGISLFLMDMSSPGITMSPLYTIGGRRRNEVVFDSVRVPKGNMVGGKNQGWYCLMQAMLYERTQPQLMTGLAQVFADLVQYVKGAEREGRPLREIPSVRSALAEVAAELDITRLLYYKAHWALEQGLDLTVEASVLKLCESELHEWLANTALEILGQYGQLESWGRDERWMPLRGAIPLMYRDCRSMQVAGGSAEVLKNIIALRVLGLPSR